MNESLKCSECGGNKCQRVSGNTYRCLYCGSTFTTKTDPVPPAMPQVMPPPQVVYIDHQRQAAPYQPIRKSEKKKSTALLLTFFLGWLGIEWFYLGETTTGILCVLFFWTGIPFLVALVHFIILLCTSNEQFDRQYNY